MHPDPYRRPGLYDLEYADLQGDILYYRTIAATRGGPLLELGVGNGRIALPVARDGVEGHGLDRSPTMLADLAVKLLKEAPSTPERVHLKEGDFRHLEGPPRFHTVFLPFNALHHCTHHQDVLDLLASVRAVLLPGGHFYLDCYLPDPALFGRDPDARYGHTTFLDPSTGQQIESWEQSGYDPLSQLHRVIYTYAYADGEREEVRLDLRVFYPLELRALIDWAGFEVVSEYADFKGGAVTATSSKWVLTLRTRA